MTEEKASPLALNLNFTRAFADGQGVSFQTTVPQDLPLEDLNGLMDKIRHASRRQALWAAVEQIENEIDHNMRQEAQLLSSMETIDRKYSDVQRVPTADKSARDQAAAAIIRVQVETSKLRGRLDTLKSELRA